MPTKVQLFTEMADHSATWITQSRERWTSFLDTAARLYKYPFPEQLMIFAQRPDAQACAPLELWNESMHRWVRRGSKGIALIDNTGHKPRLKYVFDVSDTEEGRGNEVNPRPRSPFLWELTPEHEASVMEALAKAYESDAQGDLGSILIEIASNLASEYYDEYTQDILSSVEGSYLEDLDEFNVGVTYTDALTVSLTYTLMTRCGINPADYFTDEEFMPVFDFNTPDAVNALGTGVSQLSEQVLREMEVTIKNHERQKAAERSISNEQLDISPARGLYDSRPEIAGTAERGNREIRTDATDISERTPANTVQFPDAQSETTPAPVGDRQDGGGPAGAAYNGIDNETPASGQNDRADGVGTAYEQPASPSGGNDTDRVDLQLEETEEIPSGLPGGISIPGRDEISSALAGTSIPADLVDVMLRDGGNRKNSILRIAAFFMKDKSLEENADFLCHEYVTGKLSEPGGKGFQILSEQTSMWFDETGITIATGTSAREAVEQEHITWPQAAARVRELLDAGQYISGDLLDEAKENEYTELADRLLNLYLDDFRDYREVPDDWWSAKRSRAEDVKHVSELLKDKGEHSEYSLILRGLEEDVAALDTKPDAPKHFWYDPHRILSDLRDLGIKPISYPATYLPPPVFSPFITEDEINAFFTQGSNVSESKYRILSFFLQNSSQKERVGYLKREYGHGGGSHALCGADNSWSNAEPGKGITLTRGNLTNPYDKVNISWSAAAKRIDKLITDGQYLTESEMNRATSYERTILARDISSFYAELPDEYTRPFPEELDFYYPRAAESAAISNLLFNRVKIDFLLGEMQNIMEVMTTEDRYYASRKSTFDDLTAWSNGTYTLFPGLLEPAVSSLDTARQVESQVQQTLFDTRPQPDLRSVEEQQAIIEEAQAPEAPAVSITDMDIDDAIVAWNGDPESKQRVYNHMCLHARDRSTANFLRSAYGGDLPGLIVSKENAEPMTIPWAKVQRRIAQLMDWSEFLPPVIAPVQETPIMEQPKPQPTVKAQSPEQDQDEAATTEPVPSEYILNYRYVNDRLIVSNYANYDPDEFPPIVARVEPGSKIVILDENLPEQERLEIQRVAETDFDKYKAEAEARVQQMLDHALSVAQESEAQENSTQKDELEADIQVEPTPVPHTRANFRITDNQLGEGGPKTKYGYNVAAIRTLKQIEAENRIATPNEQEILSRYVGWGGISQAFDGENSKWTKEYAELKELLTPDEYDMARASTLNAYYTSPTVIKAIYDAVERMGFKGGNILEPACGVGNFFGLLPDSMADSKLYGVELDSITGRMAKQLYQKADIRIMGFEKTGTPDAMFDIAIGNVPFGNYQVPDKRYDKNKFAIHDYFFAKTLDQVRPGGIIAFVTTNGTLDKRNNEVRKYMAQRAELLGAVRLPNDAFYKNAGTEVTTDIIFLQKRDRILDIQPDWVDLGFTEDDVPVNSYFADNPKMILGKMVFDESMYGDTKDTACHPTPGADLTEQLEKAITNIRGQITEADLDSVGEQSDASIEADPDVRNYSYTIVDDKVYFRTNSRMHPVNKPDTTLERIKGMVELRDCVHKLIDSQLDDYGEGDIRLYQAELNHLYDTFTKKYGLINATANSRAFAEDSAYYLLCSLEILNENGELDRKADMFTKRTIKQKSVVTSVDTASEALALSISERAGVDMEYMQWLTGFTEEKLISDLKGVIFRDLGEQQPGNMAIESFDLEKRRFTTADAYLSGNVRQKLRFANDLAELRPDLAEQIAPNITALEQAQPKDLDASEISVRLGSTWIDKSYIEQFVHELLQPPSHLESSIKVNYFDYTGEWGVASHRRIPNSDVLSNVTYGTGRMNAYRIIEDTLNLRDVRVYDTEYKDGKEVRELNKKETTLAQQKQDAIKQAFKEWAFKDPDRRRDLVKVYNERFNSTRPREYNGSHITFSGINPDITLRSHQQNAIAHILYGGNTLLAHEVGAGKTFEMVAAAMESKRLGLCQKSLFAVPNHLTEQMASEFLRLYPSANILVATAKDFETKNRKKFCGKIATGDYDAVIIGHSQLEKIPMSKERQIRLIDEQIWEITKGIDQLKRNDGERFSIKQLEKTKKSLEARLERLNDDSRKDDIVTFEQLGVDRLYVDEAHSFKNLFLYTKMRNVAGISQTEAQKSSDLFMKCRYLDDETDGKGVIFATGTPVSNSMTEMYTMQRYLQYDSLVQKGLTHFDCWASTFGETTTAIELAPEGTGYRARTRFAKFHNLPELMCMFKEVADIKTADMMDLPRPKANYNTTVVKPSELQQSMVKELSTRAAAVHRGSVDPKDDNMLKITSDGRKIGLDQRLINPMLPDEDGSKVNACMNNVYGIWNDTKADRLTQLVFCDFSTPKDNIWALDKEQQQEIKDLSAAEKKQFLDTHVLDTAKAYTQGIYPGKFNVYDDIKAKLIMKGIPIEEIAFIHDANTEVKKKELFQKVRQGKVRVLFGSTFKMGSGTNVQDRLIHLHDLDCPWRPADLEQRSGRIVRQGNMNPEVGITRYVTEGTFDAYLYQTIENKQKVRPDRA